MTFLEWVQAQPDTRAQVATRLGLSRDGLYKLMRGQVFPRGSTRLAIARESAGSVSVDDLLTAFNAYQAAHPKVTSAAVS